MTVRPASPPDPLAAALLGLASQTQASLDQQTRDRAREDQRQASEAHRRQLAASLRREPEATALLMIAVHLHCATCHSEQTIPSSTVQVRFGKGNARSSVGSLAGLQRYLDLPREVQHHEVTIPFCLQCFGLPG